MFEAIAIDALDMMNPLGAKLIIFLCTFIGTNNFLKRENHAWDKQEEYLNVHLSFFALILVVLLPDVFIEWNARIFVSNVLGFVNASEFSVLVNILVYMSTLLIATAYEFFIWIIVRYIKRRMG